ncbi:MAG: hypothetical protein JXB48_00330 [Candidatus Latescibacteria bacterium]|nr:hypothetical protein [Candidatus Latescibacterota bacterium]
MGIITEFTRIKKSCLKYLICLHIVFFLCCPDYSDADSWKAGAASRVITPEESSWMVGYGAGKPSAGKIHDLYVKAFAIEDPDGTKAVIVTADLIGLTKEFSNDIALEVTKRFNLPRETILFNTSHTHCGPGISNPFKTLPDEYAKKLETYVPWLKNRYIDVIGESLHNLEPVDISFSSVKPVPFAVSRRYPTPEGIAYRSSPSSYYTGGPRDDIVPVLRAIDSDGAVKAIVFGYSCHPITLNIDKFCGDYPGYAQRYIEEYYPGSVALFVQGCGGELVPNARFQLEYAMGHGKALADAVKKALDGKQIPVTGQLRCAYGEAALELQHVPDKNELEDNLNSDDTFIRNKSAYLLKQIENNGKIDTTYPCPLQAMHIGNDLLLVGIGGETVAGYSEKIKTKYSSNQFVWVAGYCNEVFAYLPTLKILKEGGYEGERAMTYFTIPSPFAETVEMRVLDGVHTLVGKISE